MDMEISDFYGEPIHYSKEELENRRDLRVINTLYVIDWLQSAIGKEALEIVEEESPIYRKHRLLHLTITLFRYDHVIPSDIRHNIDSFEVIKAIWGPDAKY